METKTRNMKKETEIDIDKRTDTSKKRIALETTLVEVEGRTIETDQTDTETLDQTIGITMVDLEIGTLPEKATGVNTGVKESQKEALAEKEGRAMGLQGLKPTTMGKVGGHEGVARRSIVWWGLLQATL